MKKRIRKPKHTKEEEYKKLEEEIQEDAIKDIQIQKSEDEILNEIQKYEKLEKEILEDIEKEEKNLIKQEALEDNKKLYESVVKESPLIISLKEKQKLANEKIEELDRDTKEQIRMLRSRLIPQTQVAISVGKPDIQVEEVLESLPETIDLNSEMYTQIEIFNTMILDLNLTISDIQAKMKQLKKGSSPEDPYLFSNLSYQLAQERKMLIDTVKARANYILNMKKLEKIIDKQKKLTDQETKLHDIINKNPKIIPEEMARKMHLSITRIRQILKKVLEKGYIKEEPEDLKKGGQRIYYKTLSPPH